MIDLFRPFMAANASTLVSQVLTPDADGRVYCGEGPKVKELEKAFAEFAGMQANPPLMLNSCTSALELALYLAEVRLGSEVITTPMTCTATNGAALRLGAKLVWADVDPITGLIDPSDVARKITKRTKAIIAVDWAGRECSYKNLRRAAEQASWLKIPIIEDAAHKLEVDLDNHGDYVCWSFQAIKHLTTGDGGALMVPPNQRERARLLRWYGLDRESGTDFRCAQDIREAGFKMHMNDIAAAIGLANLPHAARIVSAHRNNAIWYDRALNGIPGVVLPPHDVNADWWLYTVLVDDQAGFIASMQEKGIHTSPVHRRNDEHSAYYFPGGNLPGVDAFSSREVAIPVGWWLSEDDRCHVAASVWEWATARVSVAA